MKDYKEFTFGWMIFIAVIPVHLMLTYLYINKLGGRPMGPDHYIGVTVLFIFICFLFYGLTTKITSDTITVSFGIGLIRKRIPLSRIKSVEAVRSPWYYGWGLRMIPNGIMYNISGAEGVELKFHDSKRVFRIGSKDPVKLKGEIERRFKI